MKVVLIGCGGIARSSHMPAIQKLAQIHQEYFPAACCDLNAQAAAEFAGAHGIEKSYSDLETMLHEMKPDAAICLVSEPATHRVAGYLLERGIPTLLEKPPGRNLAELDSIIEQQKKSGALNMVAFNRRFMPLYTMAKANASKVETIDYAMYRVARHEAEFETTAIHAVDAVRYLASSDYERLHIDYQPLSDRGDRVVNMTLCGVMENGVAVTIRAVVSTGDIREGFDLHSSNRLVCVWNAYVGKAAGQGGLRAYRDGKIIEELDGASLGDTTPHSSILNGFYGEHEAFYRCLVDGSPSPCTLEDCRQSVELCEILGERKTAYRKG